MVKELIINPRLRDAAIPLSNDKFEELKADIQRRGCLVPIMTWKGTIVDGHNRYTICKELGIDFKTVEQHFDDEMDARLWIFNNIKNSRHPTIFQCCEMVLQFREDIEAQADQRKTAGVKSDHRLNLGDGPLEGRTDEVLGRMAGISHETMRMAMRLHDEADESTLNQLREGKLSISGAYKKCFSKKTVSMRSSALESEKKDQKKSEKRGSLNAALIKEQTGPVAETSTLGSVSPVQNEERVIAPSSEKKDLELYPEVTQLDHLMEVPAMRDDPQREPQDFMFVEDQVRFACSNYIEELRTGLRWLRDEDMNRLPELLQIIKETNKQADQMYRNGGLA